jgi:hypothetical protein
MTDHDRLTSDENRARNKRGDISDTQDAAWKIEGGDSIMLKGRTAQLTIALNSFLRAMANFRLLDHSRSHQANEDAT